MVGVPVRVLFIRLSALGDVVNTLPALAALRRSHPDVVVDWVVEDRSAELVRLVDGVERTIVFPRRALRLGLAGARLLHAHRAELRRDRYDVAIDFQGNLKSGMHLHSCRAERKVGMARAKEGAHRFADVRVDLPRTEHRATRALRLLQAALPIEPLRVRDDGTTTVGAPPIRDDDAAAADADARLPPHDGARTVLLHPGTSGFGAFKRWPAVRFGEVARRLHEATGARLRVIHGPGEEALAEAAADASGGTATVHEPRHGLPGLVALLRRADLVVAADSGPLLLASALGVRTVALFGPKDPAIYAPPFPGAVTVRRPPPCAPCSLRRCPDPICMTELPVELVLSAALRALDVTSA